MTIRITIFTAIFAVLCSSILADDPCRYVTDKGVIDLTSVGRTDGQPAYMNQPPPTSSGYRKLIVFCLVFFLIPRISRI